MSNPTGISEDIAASVLGFCPITAPALSSSSSTPPVTMHPTTASLDTIERQAIPVITRAHLISPVGLIFRLPISPAAISSLNADYNYDLDITAPKNRPFIKAEETLLFLEGQVESLDVNGLGARDVERHKSLLGKVRDAQLQMAGGRRREWDRQFEQILSSSSQGSTVCCTSKPKTFFCRAGPANRTPVDRHFTLAFSGSKTVLTACLLAVAFYLISGGTTGDSHYWLGGMQILVNVALAEFIPSSTTFSPPRIPRDIRTAVKMFDLDPILTTFVSCPDCSALYKPTGEGLFPETCIWKDFDDDNPCGESLGHPQSSSKSGQPIRTYEHQSLIQWFGRLLCTPGIEDAADTYTRNSKFSPRAEDIWNAKRLRDFKFKDGKTCVSSPPGSDTTGRYVFSFGVDWFGAHPGRKKAGVVGAVYLACQNLPSDLRPP